MKPSLHIEPGNTLWQPALSGLENPRGVIADQLPRIRHVGDPTEQLHFIKIDLVIAVGKPIPLVKALVGRETSGSVTQMSLTENAGRITGLSQRLCEGDFPGHKAIEWQPEGEWTGCRFGRRSVRSSTRTYWECIEVRH